MNIIYQRQFQKCILCHCVSVSEYFNIDTSETRYTFFIDYYFVYMIYNIMEIFSYEIIYVQFKKNYFQMLCFCIIRCMAESELWFMLYVISKRNGNFAGLS